MVRANSTEAAMGTLETDYVPGTVSGILRLHYCAGRLALFIPFFTDGETKAQRDEATSPSKWVTESEFKAKPLTQPGQHGERRLSKGQEALELKPR